MKKILVLVLLLSVGLNIGLGVRLMKDGQTSGREPWCSPGDSGPGRPGGSPRHGQDREGTFWRGVMERRLNHVADRLGLDEEQAKSFKKAHQEAAEKFLAQRIKVQEARDRLLTTISQPGFEKDAVKPLIAEAGRQQAKLDSMVTETMLREMEILTEEQRRQYLKILPLNRMAGHGGGSGHKPRHWGR